MAPKKVKPTPSESPNVFISWSGDRSRTIAGALRNWLPRVVQAARPWMSEEDIEKGSVSVSAMWARLAECGVGIVCVTPENQIAPWLNFEAGALSKAIDTETRVCPFLIGVSKADVKGPISKFQLTSSDKTDSLRMVKVIAEAIGSGLDDAVIEDSFEKFWPDFETALTGLPASPSPALPRRSERDLLEEILEIVRQQARSSPSIWASDLLQSFPQNSIGWDPSFGQHKGHVIPQPYFQFPQAVPTADAEQPQSADKTPPKERKPKSR